MTLRKILCCTAASAALMAGSAQAADLPRRAEAPVAPIYAAPIFTWTGFYVGLNAGGAWRDGGRSLTPGGTFLNPAVYPGANVGFLGGGNGDDDTRFTGGAQLGYNWQMGQLVLGIEADFNWINGNGNQSYTTILPVAAVTPGPNYVTVNHGRSSNFWGTVRPRVGWAMDRMLIYATGGLAYADSSNSGSIVLTNGVGQTIGAFTATNDSDNFGWTLGAGVEYAVTNNWTIKAEYLYVDLNRKTRTYVDPVNPGYYFTGTTGDRFHVVRAGVNFKF